MQSPTQCPKCASEYIYAQGNMWICPECAHEWSQHVEAEVVMDTAVRDAYGKILVEGDTVSVIKDLKVKGSSSVVKVGTKVKNIQITDAGDGHNIACKIEGFGAMNLKSEFVKKVETP